MLERKNPIGHANYKLIDSHGLNVYRVNIVEMSGRPYVETENGYENVRDLFRAHKISQIYLFGKYFEGFSEETIRNWLLK